MTELNQQTAKVLARVKAGEALELTERGEVIARIVPANRRVQTDEERIQQLIAEGRLRPPGRRASWDPDDWPPLHVPKRTSEEIDALLAETKGDR